MRVQNAELGGSTGKWGGAGEGSHPLLPSPCITPGSPAHRGHHGAGREPGSSCRPVSIRKLGGTAGRRQECRGPRTGMRLVFICTLARQSHASDSPQNRSGPSSGLRSACHLCFCGICVLYVSAPPSGCELVLDGHSFSTPWTLPRRHQGRSECLPGPGRTWSWASSWGGNSGAGSGAVPVVTGRVGHGCG